MNKQIDLVKLAKHLLKHCWLIIVCAVVGFVGMTAYAGRNKTDMYTASATLYVYNSNPNLVNYSYINVSDMNSAVQLLDIYMVVIKSNKVMDAVVDRLIDRYPGLTAGYVTSTLSMGSVSQTGVFRISCTTPDAQMSADICNGVVDFAPPEIIRVVGAGSIEVVDYAEVPKAPVPRSTLRTAMMGAMAGAVLAAGILVLMFLFNRRVRDAQELTDSYTLPLLAEVPRQRRKASAASELLLGENSSSYVLEAYNKLRMNLSFALLEKRNIILVSSAVPGEGKSTVAANLAITYARSGKKVLLIDGDLRRGSQAVLMAAGTEGTEGLGLANVIIRECSFDEAVHKNVFTNLDVLLAGSIPPNPAELIGSEEMCRLLKRLETKEGYDVIVMDMPPINVVSDPLVLASEGVGMLYVVRQNFSDHREIRKALMAAEFSKINMLGMMLYGEKVSISGGRKYGYGKYYHQYGVRGDQLYGEQSRGGSKWELRTADDTDPQQEESSRKRRRNTTH